MEITFGWCSNFQARKFAQVLQFTWPGCPLIYYGDELGLEGADDPHNRAPMPWGRDAWIRALRRQAWRVVMQESHGKMVTKCQETYGDLRDL